MTDDKPPTEAERHALAALEAAARPAAYAQIGGFRPDPSDRLASWWGGNFAGLPGVAAPINRATGALLSPLVQIRLDTAPVRPPCLEDTALLSFWIDWTVFTSDNPQQGVHFDVLRSPTLTISSRSVRGIASATRCRAYLSVGGSPALKPHIGAIFQHQSRPMPAGSSITN